MKKKIFYILVVIMFSCAKDQVNKISNIKVNYISIGKRYGQQCRPPFYIVEKIIKNKDYKLLVYEDTVFYKKNDTLKLYNNGKIIFNNIEAEKIDKKSIVSKNKIIYIQKIYVPHEGYISVDDLSGTIIYLTNDGILARYGSASNYISLYKPDFYADLHDKILYRKIDFKRHPEELEGRP